MSKTELGREMLILITLPERLHKNTALTALHGLHHGDYNDLIHHSYRK